MTFEEWAKTQRYRLTKNARGYYTSPATLAAQMAWKAGQYAMIKNAINIEQTKNTLRVVK